MTNRDDIAAMCKQATLTLSLDELTRLLDWFHAIEYANDGAEVGDHELQERILRERDALL